MVEEESIAIESHRREMMCMRIDGNPIMTFDACLERRRQAQEKQAAGTRNNLWECLICSRGDENEIRRNQEMASKNLKGKKETMPEENQQEDREEHKPEGPMHDMGYPTPGEEEKKRVAEANARQQISSELFHQILGPKGIVLPMAGEEEIVEWWEKLPKKRKRIYVAKLIGTVEGYMELDQSMEAA